jgi:hypothetical protein
VCVCWLELGGARDTAAAGDGQAGLQGEERQPEHALRTLPGAGQPHEGPAEERLPARPALLGAQAPHQGHDLLRRRGRARPRAPGLRRHAQVSSIRKSRN